MERSSLIAGLYMISNSSEPFARLEYKIVKRLFADTLRNLDSTIAFHRKVFTPYLNPTTGYLQKEAARKGGISDQYEKGQSLSSHLKSIYSSYICIGNDTAHSQ